MLRKLDFLIFLGTVATFTGEVNKFAYEIITACRSGCCIVFSVSVCPSVCLFVCPSGCLSVAFGPFVASTYPYPSPRLPIGSLYIWVGVKTGADGGRGWICSRRWSSNGLTTRQWLVCMQHSFSWMKHCCLGDICSALHTEITTTVQLDSLFLRK